MEAMGVGVIMEMEDIVEVAAMAEADTAEEATATKVGAIEEMLGAGLVVGKRFAKCVEIF